MLNRQQRRAYAKKLGIKTPRGVQATSTAPTHRVVYKEVIKKSRAGVEYKNYVAVLEPIKKTLIEKAKDAIFAK